MEYKRIITALMKAAPPLIEARAAVRNRCIMATALGLNVLEYFSIRAQPYPCRVSIWNAAYDELLRNKEQANKMSEDELRKTGAWIRIIDSRCTGPGWSGHLVIRLAHNRLLDLDAQQLARPDKNIFVPSPAVLLENYSEAGAVYEYEGTHVVYAQHDNHTIAQQFLKAPDWIKTPRDFQLIGATIRATKQVLQEEEEEANGSG